jgi:hypothetical protein
MLDSFGDGWNGAAWTLKAIGGDAVVAGPFTFASGASGSETFTAWTAAPTAAPTNIGDTNAPTAAPTAWPRGVNGSYVVGSYTDLQNLPACPSNANAACDFSGLVIVVECSNATLDANHMGRFFYGEGSGCSLTLLQCTLTNGFDTEVSEEGESGGL